MTGPEILSTIAIVMSGVTLIWQTILTIRLNDAHFAITPAQVIDNYADGRPHVSLELTSLGANLVKNVKLKVHADPMNHSLQLTDRSWHGIAAKASVRTTAFGIGWYPVAMYHTGPWNERFYGVGKTVDDRLATVSWTNALGIRRSQTIELPMLPLEPEYATEALRLGAERARAENPR